MYFLDIMTKFSTGFYFDEEDAIIVTYNETLIDETNYEYGDYYNPSNISIQEDGLDNKRIVNGYTPPQRPWMALLLLPKRKNMCGGSILNELYVAIADKNNSEINIYFSMISLFRR